MTLSPVVWETPVLTETTDTNERLTQEGSGPAASRHASRDGFNLEQFAAGGLRYQVVSDLNRNELDDFVRLFRSAGQLDG